VSVRTEPVKSDHLLSRRAAAERALHVLEGWLRWTL
jgi:hypothetical protein